jgi:hypothetical protein
MLSAQGRPAPARPASSDPLASQDTVVIVYAVRARSEPSPQSLSIDELPRGLALAIEVGTSLRGPWIAVRLDERTAYVPREYVQLHMAAQALTPSAPPVAVATRSEQAVSDTPAPVTLQAQVPPVREAPEPAHTAPAAAPISTRVSTPPSTPVVTPPTRSAPSPAPAPSAPRVATVDSVPSRAPERIVEPPRPAEQAAGQQPADAPSPHALRMRRPPLLGVALLGSVRPYSVTGSSTRVLHVSGDPLITISALGWGLYAAPEMGSGAGHRSTMLGGGIMRQLIDTRLLRISALAGATTYHEEPDGLYANSFTSRTLTAGSVGGLASLPLIGPARLAYRFQFVRGFGDQADFHQRRHAVGLLF